MTKEVLNSSGELIAEKRYDHENNFLGALEYEYDINNDIILTRETAHDGSIINEYIED